MCVLEYSRSLYKKMENEIAAIHQEGAEQVENSAAAVPLVIKYLKDLAAYVDEHPLNDDADEIYFFKWIKPGFISKLIFYQRLQDILSHLPDKSRNESELHYLSELEKIEIYFRNNAELVKYYYSKATASDHIYFRRREPKSWLLLNFGDYETSGNFTTVYDYKFARIMAYELLKEYLEHALRKYQLIQNLSQSENSIGSNIQWTAPKVSLVELLYALQSAGACNNGTLDLKQLAHHFEELFNVKLGNYYRVFQEMRIRKSSRTSYLDLLKDKLVQRMDGQDENPKFRY